MQTEQTVSTVKYRLLEFINKQGIRKECFFSSTGIARPNFYGTNAKSELGGDKIIKILEAYSNLNPVWLLTGKGDMLLFDTRSEEENWIVYNAPFHSCRHSDRDLLRVGVRIDEICYSYGITHEQLAEKVAFDSNELAQIISGSKPAPVELLQKIEQLCLNISSAWLYSGKGSMHTIVSRNGKEQKEYGRKAEHLRTPSHDDKERRISTAKKLHEQGKSYREIGRQMNVSDAAVRKWFKYSKRVCELEDRVDALEKDMKNDE
jgi:transcriptional regulator with XRE-family HTH domain